MATSRWLKEAVNRLSTIYWTEDIMLRTLRKIALDNPAAFLAAVNAVEAQDREPQAMRSAGFAQPEPAIEPPVECILKIISYAPENKIKVLKAYREITGLGLGISMKNIESSFPIFVSSGDIATIKAARLLLDLAGATCSVS